MLKEYKKHHKLMGNAFEITVVDTSEDKAYAHIDGAIAEIQRIEKLLTTFNEDSQTNLINRNAGIKPAKVDMEILDLIARSLKISKITDGYFDISYGGIDKNLWNFDRKMTKLSSADQVKKHLDLVNYRNTILDLESDLTAWGQQSNGKPWTLVIADPDSARQPFSYLNINDIAIATSGNYENFVVIDGKKYSHTITPKTRMPVSGVKSITIFCPNAEIADAMATPAGIMGAEAAIDMINQINHLECIIIDDHNRIFTSDNVHLK